MADLKAPRRSGDLVVRESDHVYGRDSVKLDAGPVALTITDRDPIGVFCIADGTIVLAGAEATITGIVVEATERLPASMAIDELTTKPVAVLRRGHVVINKAAIPLLDPVGGTFNVATIVTRLEALGFKVLTDPQQSSTQTT